jgi:hypothetical protein
MTVPPTFKPDDIELVPESWERFERAVDTVVKGGPQHRAATQKRPKAAVRDDDQWMAFVFDGASETLEAQPSAPSADPAQRPSPPEVAAYFRQSGNEAELIFPR